MNVLELISYVKRGKNHKIVFLTLDKPMMPSELVIKIYGKNSNTFFNLVSRALSELNKVKIIKILNPKEKTGRLYQKTKLGEEITKKIRDIENLPQNL